MNARVIIKDYSPDADGYVVESVNDNGELFYTICINAKMNDQKQRETFYHEMIHIQENDFGYGCMDCLEEKRHDDIDQLKYEFAI